MNLQDFDTSNRLQATVKDSRRITPANADAEVRHAFRPRRTDLLFWLPDLPDTKDSRRLMGVLGAGIDLQLA